MESLFYTGLEPRSKLLKEFGFTEENREVIPEQFKETGFPKPTKAYMLSMEAYDLSLEEPYFWVLEEFKRQFPIIEKLEDSFAAAENSAFFGITQQRLGAQQDRAAQFLKGSSDMIKGLFQMVRELRIIDERLTYYNEAEEQTKKEIGKRSKSAEITLKGFFVDLVQGAAKNPASVFGMARELEFITLPDLFFDAPPFLDTAELDAHIKSLEKDFNRSLLRVLERHLRQFMEWKKRTYQEHANRKRFMLQYLLQHFEIIKMYLTWVKPYLRSAARLTMKERNVLSPDLISAFEGSMLDIEILARKPDEKGNNSCLLATFSYRTRPEMKVVQEGYQRGPVHIGRYEMNFRIYGWTDQEVENYKKLKNKEIMELMGDVSSSVQKAMESLGKELDLYLAEARGEKAKGEQGETEKKKPEKKSVLEKLFGDFYTQKSSGAVKSAGEKQSSGKSTLSDGEAKKAAAYAGFHAFNMYKNFKKAHGMVQW